MTTMLEQARRAVELAKAKGAQEAAAGAYLAREAEVQWRDGRVEKLHEATTRGLGLQLYVDGRYSSVSTSDLRPEALERFVEDAVALARAIAKDPFRSLPDPELYRGQSELDLLLADPACDSVDGAGRRQRARALEEAARAEKGAEAIVSVTSSASDSISESARVHSNGFEGTRRDTSFWMFAEASVKDPDGRRPEDYDYAGARFFSETPAPEVVGRGAARRALSRVGATKGASGVMTVAVENRAAARMLGMLLGPLAAASLQQKRSMFEGRLGQAIGNERLDVWDDPLVVKGFGSQLWDGEGIAARRFPLFEKGVLRNFYVDNYYGRKLSMPPTTGRATNVSIKPGPSSADELLSQMQQGLLVTSFLGGNSNGTTGDFSVGIQGFVVRGGRVAEPFSEMNISGNHLELWRRLAAVGNDPYPYSAMRTPTLVFEGVQVAGT